MSKYNPLTNLPQVLTLFRHAMAERRFYGPGRGNEKPSGYGIEELNLPGEKDRIKRELWCFWSKRNLLPMVLPKTERDIVSAEPLNRT